MAITINTIEELKAIGDQLGFGGQDRLDKGEFESLVKVTQGLLGVEFTDVEEEVVTREGLAALGRLLNTGGLGIDTKEGRKTAIVAGLTRRAAKRLLKAYWEDQRQMDIGP